MIENHTKKDIELIANDILKSSKCNGVFPTPVDKIVEYSELVINKNNDISVIHPNFISKATNSLISALSKIRGALDRSEKTIYLDLSQKPNRKNFVKLHEVGHHVLPWQNTLHDYLSDNDETLSENENDNFEAEANYFASYTLFQGNHFVHEMNKLSLHINSSIFLSKHFGASVHATLRRFVEYSNKRCALIVLENINTNDKLPLCSVKDIFFSIKFLNTFGEILIPNQVGYTWSFVKDYYFKKRYNDKGLISLMTLNGEANFNYHFFNNGFNALVFIFPLGEKNSSKTKFIHK